MYRLTARQILVMLFGSAVLAAVTLVVAAGVLEAVTGSMMFPDPEATSVRERVLAAQSERALQIRELSRGEMRVADTASSDRI